MATQVTSMPQPAKAIEKPKPGAPVGQVTGQRPPYPDEIRISAYLRWEAAGKPPGNGINFWLDAERAFLQRK